MTDNVQKENLRRRKQTTNKDDDKIDNISEIFYLFFMLKESKVCEVPTVHYQCTKHERIDSV